MKSAEDLKKELNMKSLEEHRDKVLNTIIERLRRDNGTCVYYRHDRNCGCSNPVIWNMVLDELRKGGYTVSSRVNSHGVTSYTIHI